MANEPGKRSGWPKDAKALIDELNAKLKTIEEELDTTKDKLQTTKDKLQTTKEELQTTKNELSSSEALRLGNYYASIKQIGEVTLLAFDDRWYDEIKRTERCSRYEAAIKAAEEWEDGQQIATASGRSHYSGTSLTVAGMDDNSARKQTKKLKTTHIDGAMRESAQIAHMLAFSSKSATFCAEFVLGAAGVDFVDDSRKEQRQQALVHGIMDEEGRNKKAGTGMKHYRDNMARILHQGKYVDQSPAVLMMPILTLDKVKKPDSLEYDVAIICLKASIYQEMVFTEKTDTCTPAEITMAVERLNEFVQAAGYYLWQRSAEDFDVLGHQEKTKLKDSWEKIKGESVYAEKRVQLLVPYADEELAKLKVIKVKLSNASDGVHSYIDPWLLLMKNAIMLSDMANFKLLPGCGFGASKEDSTSEDESGSGSGIPMTISVADCSASSDITDIE